MQRILFVCMGNICRSPSAEAIFTALVKDNGLTEKIKCDSAGTVAYHAGHSADERMKHHALKRGYTLLSISRPFNPAQDFDTFDYIIGMDPDNIRDLKAHARSAEDLAKISLMTDYCTGFQKVTKVPDPYYGGDAGFEHVLDLLDDACKGLLNALL